MPGAKCLLYYSVPRDIHTFREWHWPKLKKCGSVDSETGGRRDSMAAAESINPKIDEVSEKGISSMIDLLKSHHHIRKPP